LIAELSFNNKSRTYKSKVTFAAWINVLLFVLWLEGGLVYKQTTKNKVKFISIY